MRPVSVLREVVETLAPLRRKAGSEGEAEAAAWLAERMAPARIETAPFHDGYARLLGGLAAGALLGALTRRRWPGLLAAALLADDVSNGPRLGRRLVAPRRVSQNVIAEIGEGERTLVVLAHHDAAPTGAVFDQTLHRTIAARFPDMVERTDTAAPIWWPVMAGPVLVALGRRRVGGVMCAVSAVFFADIARDRIVPGANDNLSGVAVLVALAERLRARPVEGLRVLLVSCGAEEVMQGGIRAFMRDHAGALPRDRTWFLNLDTVGSPRLVMLEGEGCFVMEDYRDPAFRDAVATAAERAGIPLKRGMRARASTDSVIPSRAGYPTATLCSVDHVKAIPNYHLMSDTPENLDYGTVERALDLAEAVARAVPSIASA